MGQGARALMQEEISFDGQSLRETLRETLRLPHLDVILNILLERDRDLHADLPPSRACYSPIRPDVTTQGLARQSSGDPSVVGVAHLRQLQPRYI